MAGCHIVFVCTGNTGRSVAAAALSRRVIDERGLTCTVGSRGIGIDSAHRLPEPHVLALLGERGIDVAMHRAASLTAADVAVAGHILTMTVRHREIVLERFPAAHQRVRTLSEAAFGIVEDVPDAFGAPRGIYEAMLARLDALVRAALDRLVG